MARGKKHTAEQIVNLLRQVEVAAVIWKIANDLLSPLRMAARADAEVGWQRPLHTFRIVG